MRDVRALAKELSAPDSQWGAGGPQEAIDTAGKAVETLTGYVPEVEQLARVTDRALEAVQALHADLEDDETLEGDGQTARTAVAALDALAETCD